MERVFIDTNVLIDFLGKREGYFQNAAAIFQLAEDRKIHIFVSPISVTTLEYVLTGKYFQMSKEHVNQSLQIMAEMVTFCDVGDFEVRGAIEQYFKDFEDQIQYNTAFRMRCTCLITRNPKDFEKGKEVRILTPQEFLAQHI